MSWAHAMLFFVLKQNVIVIDNGDSNIFGKKHYISKMRIVALLT